MPKDPAVAESMVVIEPLNPWACTGCGGSGSLLFMEDAGPLCLDCADLDHLVFLPAGDAALSRRARKASGLAAVVVRFSRSRKRYERQGILVEEAALEQAEAQCLADEEARARRRERDRQRRADQDVAFQARLAEAGGGAYPEGRHARGCGPTSTESWSPGKTRRRPGGPRTRRRGGCGGEPDQGAVAVCSAPRRTRSLRPDIFSGHPGRTVLAGAAL